MNGDSHTFRRRVPKLLLPLSHVYWRLKWGDSARRLIIGCGMDDTAGWVRSDIFQVPGGVVLDATNEDDWARYFRPAFLTHIFTEHMLEHLDAGALAKTLALCWKYLAPGGRLRVAVPDANRKDPAYIEEVAPPADGHKQYFTARALESLFSAAGFTVLLLEYYDSRGHFHRMPWDPEDGFVRRSYAHDGQKAFQYNDHYYTSIILDAFKPS